MISGAWKCPGENRSKAVLTWSGKLSNSATEVSLSSSCWLFLGILLLWRIRGIRESRSGSCYHLPCRRQDIGIILAPRTKMSPFYSHSQLNLTALFTSFSCPCWVMLVIKKYSTETKYIPSCLSS